MPQAAKANKQAVKAAIQQLKGSGENPSVRKIHRLIGGDYNAVTRLVKEINVQVATRQDAPIQIRALFESLADDVYTQVHTLAEASFEKDREAFSRKIEEVEADLEEAGLAVTELSSMMDDQTRHHKTELAALNTALSQMKSERDDAFEQAKLAIQTVSELHERHDLEMSSQKAALDDAQTAQIRLIEEKNEQLVSAMQANSDVQEKRIRQLEQQAQNASEHRSTLSEESTLRAS